jgi:hypothetical protein
MGQISGHEYESSSSFNRHSYLRTDDTVSFPYFHVGRRCTAIRNVTILSFLQDDVMTF